MKISNSVQAGGNLLVAKKNPSVALSAGLRAEGCDSNSHVLVATRRRCSEQLDPATSELSVARFSNVAVTGCSQLTSTEENKRKVHAHYPVLGMEG